MTLLGVTIPAVSWIGVGLTIVIGLITWLGGGKVKRIEEDIKENKEGIEELKDELNKRIEDLIADLEAEKLSREMGARATDNRINDLHINILNRLDDIKDKFNEFRK